MTAVPTPRPVPHYVQLGVTWVHADYRRAAEVLWGQAGRYAVDEYQRLNGWLFDRSLPPLPIVIGLSAYGRCIGSTQYRGQWDAGHLPRISLVPGIFGGSERVRGGCHEVTDVLVHEMVHARLILAGEDPGHNGHPWCAEVMRLSPLVLGHQVKAAPVHPRRIDGKVVRAAKPEHLDRDALAKWPGSLRPPGWDLGDPIPVDTY